jgi:two-component system response regulator LytT
MRVLIIEDESLAAERLERLLYEIDATIEIIGIIKSIKSTINFLQSNPQPDLILIDIELSDGQCFELFKKVTITSPVIFTTSYNEYAFDAFQANSIDYLLKPIRQRDLQNSIIKYHNMKQQFVASFLFGNMHTVEEGIRKSLIPTHYQKSFLVKQGQQYIPLDVSDIAYFFVEGRLTYIVTWSKVKLVLDYTLEEVERKVDPQLYYRANRAFIVHRRSIRRFKHSANRKLEVDLMPAAVKEVIISKEKITNFKQWMST